MTLNQNGGRVRWSCHSRFSENGRDYLVKGINMIRMLIILGLTLSGCGDIVKSVEEGRAYGKGHTLGECSKESMARLNACDGASCAAMNIGFPRGCVKTSRSDRNFCATAPVGIMDAVATIIRECSDHRFPKACAKYRKLPIARCLNERAS